MTDFTGKETNFETKLPNGPVLHFSFQLLPLKYFLHNRYAIILGNPGATSRDDAIFSGESLLQEFQKLSNSVPLIGQKNIFLANQRGVLAG